VTSDAAVVVVAGHTCMDAGMFFYTSIWRVSGGALCKVARPLDGVVCCLENSTVLETHSSRLAMAMLEERVVKDVSV
jgi:hypothetical protein